MTEVHGQVWFRVLNIDGRLAIGTKTPSAASRATWNKETVVLIGDGGLSLAIEKLCEIVEESAVEAVKGAGKPKSSRGQHDRSC
jgi:hypothetical protein